MTLETILFQNQVLPLNLTLNKFLGNLQTLRTFVRFILAQSGFHMAIVISARADEKKAIEMYKQIIEMSRKESDETTALLFMEILKDEEDHHDTFETLLQQV